jgi:hypothetical protein
MKQRLGSALMENLDLLVEFSTLGEYRLDDGSAPAPAPAANDGLEPATPVPAAPAPLPSRPLRDGLPARSAPAPTLIPGRVAAATAAGRRARRGSQPARPVPPPRRRKRAGAPEPAEQLCLSA